MTRIHTPTKRIASVVFAVSSIALVACADGDSRNSTAPAIQVVDCAEVQDLLDKAIGDAAEAEEAADESRGTPDGPSDADKAEAAEELVDELTEKKEECESAATTTSTSTSTTTSVATPNASPTTTMPTTTTVPTSSPSVVPEGDLEIDRRSPIPEAAKCKGGYEFNTNSLPSPEKFSSDSVSLKFVSSEPDAMFKEYMEEQCVNPTLLENTIDGFCEGEIVIGDFDVCERNSWMTEFTTLLDEQGPTAAFLLEVDGDWFVTSAFQRYAEMANTILLFYDVRGIEKLRSVRNWHLAGPVGDDLPRVVENDRQEGLPALILVYTLKDFCPQQTGASVIGFNVNDKRFEIFKKECEPPPCVVDCGPPKTVPPTTVPCGNKNHIDPVTGECVPNLVTGSTTPPPSTVPASATTTTLACTDGTHRDTATGQCISNDPPDEDPATDPSVPDGNNNGPVLPPSNPY